MPFEFKHLQYCRENVQKTDTNTACIYLKWHTNLHDRAEENLNGGTSST